MSPQLAVVVDERGQIASAVQFLSSCKHRGLWDCSALGEQYAALRSHCGFSGNVWTQAASREGLQRLCSLSLILKRLSVETSLTLFANGSFWVSSEPVFVDAYDLHLLSLFFIGGLCQLHGGIRVCSCRAGFTGQRCEININECAGNPCLNGGTCQDRINDYTCICPAGYGGRNCDRILNECSLRACLNGGTCSGGGGPGKSPATCSCPAGFTGPQCEYFAVTSPVTTGENKDGFQWAAVSLAVGLVALLVVLCMVVLALRHIHRQAQRQRRESETMNNLSSSQRDNLIPVSQLKNTNQKISLEVDCDSEKSNFIHKNYHLDPYNSKSKEFKDEKSQEDKSLIYDKGLDDKMPLSRVYR